MFMRLTILITGASSGLREEFARELAGRGAKAVKGRFEKARLRLAAKNTRRRRGGGSSARRVGGSLAPTR